MLIPLFDKSSNHEPKKFQIFLILRRPFYHLRCSAKEHVQQLPGMDPILVVKTPVYFRRRPPGLQLPHDCLRSTWILTHGKWEKMEDRVSPLEQQDRFDRWVERACFQYHPVKVSVPTPWANAKVSPVSSLRDPPASPVRPGSSGRLQVTCNLYVRAQQVVLFISSIDRDHFRTFCS